MDEGRPKPSRDGSSKEELDIIRDHVSFILPPPTPDEEWLSFPELPTAEELNPDWSSGSVATDVMNGLVYNDVSQPYVSKMKYLETHYRLNREEGITFLRFGIREYRQNPTMMDNDNTCVYTKVFVQGYLMTRVGPVCRVQFSTERAGKKIPWTTSQRLTPGTLVALTTASDNFKTICKPAVIADRPIRSGLDQKPPTIQILWADLEDAVFDPAEELVMIESRRGFYEAVRHTLVGLQHVARSNSPLLKYLVAGSKIDSSPQYVLDHPRMDITPLLQNHHLPANATEKEQLLSTYRNCEVLDGFPHNVQGHTSLDNSQLQAVHRILTKELAICQGPPGTGKTFTSLQSLKCMINTLTAGMTKATKEVIIVAAETNHALDQMLKHLIKSEFNVLRLGRRTCDEQITKHTLFHFRQQTPARVDRDSNNLEAARKKLIWEIEATIKEMFPQDLLKPELLLRHGLITPEQFDSLTGEEWTWKASPGKPTGIMSEWLGTSLQDTSAYRFADPVFDDEEILEESSRDGINEGDFNLDIDDPTPFLAIDEDSARLKGTWLEMRRNWKGLNLQHYHPNDVRIKMKLKKQNLFHIEEKWRGPVYEYLQKNLLAIQQKALSRLFANYTRICRNTKINNWKRDIHSIRSMNIHIIGCTTTGLSKYRGLLAALKPKTILIEEAAQSREAHIAAALLPTLQQLILVGDHQQLAPHCDVPGLADSYHNLTVSMFERLVSYLRLPYTMLNQQRRMVADIRAVLNPFYPNLGDHPSVWSKTNRPDVPGMPFNSYLFNHEWHEQTDMETFSKYNLNEAEMIVRFALYLVQNGTSAKQITILTFYRGQRKTILTILRRELVPSYGNINVSTVDSYQGEENDIILLSLVRSNVRNRLGVAGFVGDMNRGVVSISRARRGLYIFGNIQNLEYATETSKFMWGSVREVFERMNRYDVSSPHLPLQCQNHGNITFAVDTEYFQKTHGGCWENCSDRFEGCGHPCGRRCHPMPHDKLICQHPCERKLGCGHSCSKVCGAECWCESRCPVFVSYIQQLRIRLVNEGHQLSTRLTSNNPWAENHVTGFSESKADALIDHKPMNSNATKEHIRDEWHPVSSSKNGYRKVDKGILIENDTFSGICDTAPRQKQQGSHDGVYSKGLAEGQVLTCKFPQQDSLADRTANDWEVSTSDGEEQEELSQSLARFRLIEAAKNSPFDDDEEDLITF